MAKRGRSRKPTTWPYPQHMAPAKVSYPGMTVGDRSMSAKLTNYRGRDQLPMLEKLWFESMFPNRLVTMGPTLQTVERWAVKHFDPEPDGKQESLFMCSTTHKYVFTERTVDTVKRIVRYRVSITYPTLQWALGQRKHKRITYDSYKVFQLPDPAP